MNFHIGIWEETDRRIFGELVITCSVLTFGVSGRMASSSIIRLKSRNVPFICGMEIGPLKKRQEVKVCFGFLVSNGSEVWFQRERKKQLRDLYIHGI